MGPLASRSLELEIDLADRFAAEQAAGEPPEGEAPKSSPLSPPELAQAWTAEALVMGEWRSRPLPPPGASSRQPGAVPGTSSIVDPTEPFPVYIRVTIPEKSPTSDELLTRALAGAAAPSRFEWRGGTYSSILQPTTRTGGESFVRSSN